MDHPTPNAPAQDYKIQVTPLFEKQKAEIVSAKRNETLAQYARRVPDVESKMLSHRERIAKLKAADDEIQKPFIALGVELANLRGKAQELVDKGKGDPKYVDVAQYAQKLDQTLAFVGKDFFANPTLENFDTLQNVCDSAIDTAETEFKKQRGVWANIHPVVRGALGVLAFGAIIPALIVTAKSNHGFIGTFFKTHETDSMKKANALKEALSETRVALETKSKEDKSDASHQDEKKPPIH